MSAKPPMRGRSSGTGAELMSALVAMTAEAVELEAALGQPVTDAVARWLAPQYAQAATEVLAGLEGRERLDQLRTFAQDWALLRKGDQTSERLQIERERLAAFEREQMERFKRRTVLGLEALFTYVKDQPKAKEAFDALVEQVRHPWDPREQGPIGARE